MFRFSFPQLFTFGPFNPFGACMNVPSFNNFWMAGWSGMSTPPSIFASMPPYPQYSAANAWQMGTVNNMSMYPGLCLGGASPASTSRTAEEKSNEKKLSDLKAVAREVIKNLSGDSRVTLQTAIDKNDGTVLERVTALENALKANKSEVEKVLLNPPTTLKAGNKTLAKVLEELCLKSNLQNSNVQIMNGALAGSDDINKEEVASLGITKSNVLAYIEKMGSFEYIEGGKNALLLKGMHEALADVAKAVIDNNEVKPELQNAVSDIWVEYNNDKSAATLDSFKQLYAATLLAVSELADRKSQVSLGEVVSSNFYTDRARNLLTKAGISSEIIEEVLSSSATSSVGDAEMSQSNIKQQIMNINVNNDDVAADKLAKLKSGHESAAEIFAKVIAQKDKLTFSSIKLSEGTVLRAKLPSGEFIDFDLVSDNGLIRVGKGEKVEIRYAQYKTAYAASIAEADGRSTIHECTAVKAPISGTDFEILEKICEEIDVIHTKSLFTEGFNLNFSNKSETVSENYKKVQVILDKVVNGIGNLKINSHKVEETDIVKDYVVHISDNEKVKIMVDDEGDITQMLFAHDGKNYTFGFDVEAFHDETKGNPAYVYSNFKNDEGSWNKATASVNAQTFKLVETLGNTIIAEAEKK